ncbi:SET domain-containing protein, partial [Eremomyces bilateralis CBS 781.70]
EDFTQWAKEHGIKICGVKAHEIPSHGIGIVATRDLREGERVLFIPRSAMVTPASKGAKQLRLPEASSGQTRIAAYLTLSSQCEEFGFRDWQRTWPSIEALQASIPFFWPVELQSLLPPSAVALLKHQSLLISESWRQVKHLVPKASKSRFLYYYFIINSRTMYWRDTDSGNHRSTSAANNLALCPFLDFLNHSPSCQPATRTDQGYEIRTERPYVAGEEIFVSYGAHGNDFLLVEYGFLPEPGTNVWDSLSIDHFIIPALSTGQNDTLARYGFLGDYTLFLGTPATEQPEPCFRTLVALFLI